MKKVIEAESKKNNSDTVKKDSDKKSNTNNISSYQNKNETVAEKTSVMKNRKNSTIIESGSMKNNPQIIQNSKESNKTDSANNNTLDKIKKPVDSIPIIPSVSNNKISVSNNTLVRNKTKSQINIINNTNNSQNPAMSNSTLISSKQKSFIEVKLNKITNVKTNLRARASIII